MIKFVENGGPIHQMKSLIGEDWMGGSCPLCQQFAGCNYCPMYKNHYGCHDQKNPWEKINLLSNFSTNRNLWLKNSREMVKILNKVLKIERCKK